MSLSVAVLFVSLIAGYPDNSAGLRCGEPNSYSVEVVIDPLRDADDVNIVQGGRVLKAIKLPGQEVNGFSLNQARKTKAGFEFSIDYGSVIYYHKQFIFICRRNKFYLSRVIVDSFNKHNPEKWYKKVHRINPNLPLEKFEVTNFMREVFPPRKLGLKSGNVLFWTDGPSIHFVYSHSHFHVLQFEKYNLRANAQ